MESEFIYVVIIKYYRNNQLKQNIARAFYKEENAEKYIELFKQDIKKADEILHTESLVDFEIKSVLIE